MDKLKVLVLGDGLLGSEIIKQSNWEYLSRKSSGFDIYDLEKSFPTSIGKIDVVLNCIAHTDTYSKEKKEHWDTNFLFVSNLIKFCNSNLIKLVHISTDYIYSNSIENASEDDVPVHCDNWYGYTKLLGDGLVQLEANNYLLVRCTHKPNPFPYEKAWVDQIGNFDYVNNIAELIIKLIRKNANGLYNVGTDIKSMYDLAIQTKNIIGVNSPTYIPKNTTMGIDKMEAFLNNGVIKPFFSIAIPTYGYDGMGVQFLDDNFKFLTTQTFKDFEVVISDHSNDDTIKTICNKWGDTLKIKYFRNEHGRGFISPNLNIALKNSTGKYIKILFQDDFLFDENALKIQYDTLTENKDIKWVVSTFCHSNDGINFYRTQTPKYVDNIWNGTNLLGNPSNLTIINKYILYFDETLNWLMDCEYYYRLFLRYGNPTIIPQITVVNRTHGCGLTDTTTRETKDKELNNLKNKYAPIT